MTKFNKSRQDYLVINISEILDTNKTPLEVGTLVILDAIAVDRVINMVDLLDYFQEDTLDAVMSIAKENGYKLIDSPLDSSTVKKTLSVDKKSLTTAKRFVPPTIDEVREYMSSIGIFEPDKTAERFIAYYTSNGWMVGKMKMKDWKSACVTWKTRQQERNQAAPAGMVKVFPRGSQRPIVITKEEYDKSVQSGTNYYKLIQ